MWVVRVPARGPRGYLLTGSAALLMYLCYMSIIHSVNEHSLSYKQEKFDASHHQTFAEDTAQAFVSSDSDSLNVIHIASDKQNWWAVSDKDLQFPLRKLILNSQRKGPVLDISSYREKRHKLLNTWLMRAPLEYSLEDFDNYFAKSDSPSYRIKYNYLVNSPYVCTADAESGKKPYLIVQVHSHPDNTQQRDSIRDTWGSISRDFTLTNQVRLLFLLGSDVHNNTSRGVLRESKLYRDVVQFDFIDNYDNLTLKSLMGLQWITQFCDTVPFILKSDDDMFIHIPSVLEILQNISANRILLGALNNGAKVMRHGRWNLPKTKYPFATYPPYLSGNAYVMSGDVAHALLHTAPYVPLLPIEDVYVTGILPKTIGLQPRGHGKFPHWADMLSVKNLCYILDKKLLGVHGFPGAKMFALWKVIKQTAYNCSTGLHFLRTPTTKLKKLFRR